MASGPSAPRPADADLERRIAELEQKMQRLEHALRVGIGGDLTITAPIVNIECGMTRSSGVIQCDTIIAANVVGASYTPGAGNMM